MDVTLPDGTVIQGVPDGTSRAQLVEKLKANGYDTSWYKEEPKARSLIDETGRQIGLTGRYALEGLGSVPQILGGAMEAAGIKGAGANVGRQIADVIGLPSPETGIEKVSGAVSSAMAGGVPFLKAGQVISNTSALSETAKQVGSVMASHPAAQLGLSGVSGGASEMAKEGGLGPGSQFAAGVAAPLVAAPIASTALGAGKMIGNIVRPLSSESGLEQGAARLATKALGGRAQQGIEALSAAPKEMTGGQVAAAIDNADLAAIQKLVNQRDATFSELIKQGTQVKIKNAWDALESSLAPVRQRAFNLADQGGVDVSTLLNKATAIANSRGKKTSDVVQKSMQDFIDKVKVSINPQTGTADPIELNNIRGQLRNYIEKHSQESKDWDQKRTATLERQLQLAIDDAIDAAIAKADPNSKGLWSGTYMKPYREGAARIRAVESNLEKEIELATKGTPEVSKIISDTENPVRGVNLLSRIASLTNFAVRAAEGSAGKAVEKKLAQMLAPSEMGGDKQRLAQLMQEQLNRPNSMFQDIWYQPGLSRAQLGYGVPDAFVKPEPQSRRIQINQDIPYSGFPTLGNAPVIPGSWREGMLPRIETGPGAMDIPSPNPLLGMKSVKEGMLGAPETPLPKLPPLERGMLSLAEDQPTRPTVQQLAPIDFPLRQEVLQQLEPQITAFRQEAARLQSIIDNKYPITGKPQAKAREDLAKLQSEFAAGMRQLGIDTPQEAIGLQRLYQSGEGTKLRIEKTERK